MLSRREMGALCAALLLCFLLSLGAGWAKGQLDAADALMRRHPAAHHGPTPTQCGTRARSWPSGMPCWPLPTRAASGRQSRRQGLGGVKSRPARTDSPGGAGSAGHPTHRCTPASSICISPPGATQERPARRTVRCSAAGHRDSPAGPQLVVCALPGPLPVGLRRVCTARRKRPRLRGVPRAIPAGGVVGRSHRPPGGCRAGRGNALPRRRIG